MKEIVSKPSDLLKELIDLVNLAPPDAVFPPSEEFSDLFDKIIAEESIYYKNGLEELMEKKAFVSNRIFHAICPYPELQRFLTDLPKSKFYRHEDSKLFIDIPYDVFVENRKVLRRFAEAAMSYSNFEYTSMSDREIWATNDLPEKRSVALGGIKIERHILSVEIINGRFEVETNPFFEAIRKADVSRLRICPICQRIFWAYRKTSFGCSKKHSTAVRTRKWRGDKKESEEKLKNHFQPRSKNDDAL